MGIIIAYLCTCFIPYINTGKYWMIALLGLGFPILFFALWAFIILWILWKSKWWIVSLVVLLLGFRQIGATFAFHFPSKYVQNNDTSTLKIMQWNVKGWDDYNPQIDDFDISHSQRNKMMEFIGEMKPDIIFIQEFYENKNQKKYISNYKTLDSLGYHFHISAMDFQDNVFYTGIAIFSKFPISDSVLVPFESDSKSQSLLYGDIDFNGKKIRIMTTHLQSVRFKPDDYKSLSELKRGKTKNISQSKTIIAKLKDGYDNRYHQTKLVKSHIDASPYPVILTGDFNDVPTSNTYFTISKNMKDAFLKKGFFIGRSFRFISPTLRIDYILTSPQFNIEQFEVVQVPYSDHYPLMAEISVK